MLVSGLYKILIKKYTKPQLKNKTQEMSLWLKISFHNEKWSWDSLMLMYVITLGKSSIFDKFLENIIQFGWLDTSTSSFPLQFFKLGNKWIKDNEGSWIKTILNEICVLRIVLIIFANVLQRNFDVLQNHAWMPFITEQIDCFLLLWSSWYFLKCYSLLK